MELNTKEWEKKDKKFLIGVIWGMMLEKTLSKEDC